MSDIVIAVATQDDDGGAGVPPPRYPLVYRVRMFGYGVLGLQLIGFLVWSAVLYDRFSVTMDFSAYYQPWFLIAHGDLDPYSTIMGLQFWRNYSDFLLWLQAPLYWVDHSGVLLSWLQDVSIVGAEAVALTWLCDLARRGCRERDAAWLAGLGLVLLVANPWTWWSVSFDAHPEPQILIFAVLLAWDLFHGRRRAWAWVLPVLAAGAPTAIYLVGIGLGGVLAGRRSRRSGAALVLLGVGYSLLLVFVHGDAGVSPGGMYGYLASGNGHIAASPTLPGLLEGIARHPMGVVRVLWDKRADLFANLAPGGLLGLGVPILLPLVVVVMLASSLAPGFLFAEPIFQNLPAYVLLPVGTVAVLGWLIRRHRPAALALAGLIAAQALGWAVVWGPRTADQWLRVPAPAAATLARVDARIPASAEVIASQGVLGRFADRMSVYGLGSGGLVPVHGTTWFVITPDEGIETASAATSMALVAELAGPLHATLVAHANGVWAFRWTPPPGVSEVTVPDGSAPLPAWAAAGAAAQALTAGSVSDWRASATGAKGYIADGLEWLDPPGRYLASVTLSAAGPVNVEVWDDTSGALVARRTVPATDGTEQVTMPVTAPDAPNATAFSGWGPFRADFVPPPTGQRLEVRVWSPGGLAVSVYNAALTAVSDSPGAVRAASSSVTMPLRAGSLATAPVKQGSWATIPLKQGFPATVRPGPGSWAAVPLGPSPWVSIPLGSSASG